MILLVDGNNLARRAFATMELTTPSGKDVSAIYGTLKMVKSAVDKFKPQQIIVAWDIGRSEYRCSLFSGYKSNRKNRTPDEEERYRCFNSQAEEVRLALEYLGVVNVWQENVEADDLIYAIIRKSPKKQMVVLTNDRDLLQVVNRKVSVFLPLYKDKGKTTGKLVTPENFQQIAKVSTVGRFIEYKCLTGDDSDGIPGVYGVGEKSAILLLEEKGYTIEQILAEKPKEVSGNKRLANILASKDILTRNRALVSLADANKKLELSEAMERLEEPPLKSYQAFKKLCMTNAFVSILSEFSSWKNTFDSLGGD